MWCSHSSVGCRLFTLTPHFCCCGWPSSCSHPATAAKYATRPPDQGQLSAVLPCFGYIGQPPCYCKIRHLTKANCLLFCHVLDTLVRSEGCIESLQGWGQGWSQQGWKRAQLCKLGRTKVRTLRFNLEHGHLSHWWWCYNWLQNVNDVFCDDNSSKAQIAHFSKGGFCHFECITAHWRISLHASTCAWVSRE